MILLQWYGDWLGIRTFNTCGYVGFVNCGVKTMRIAELRPVCNLTMRWLGHKQRAKGILRWFHGMGNQPHRMKWFLDGKYNLKAKHITDSTSKPTSSVQQPTLDHCIRHASRQTSARVTTSIAKWIAKDCRSVSIVADQVLKEVIRIATSDPSFELPSR